MSDLDPPELAQAVVDDLTSTDWQTRLQTILLTVGVLAFGFMLGVHFMAQQTFTALTRATSHPDGLLYETALAAGDLGLQSTYTNSMKAAMTVAIVGIAMAVLADELSIGRDTEEEDDAGE